MAQTIDLLASEFSQVPVHQNGVVRWPNLRAIAQSFFTRQYADDDCWRLVWELLQAGGFVEVEDDPVEACKRVQEIWFQDDPRDPLTLVQPWDWFLMYHPGSPAVQHPGLVVDTLDFIHAHRGAGVTIEPMRRYRHRLVQVARLRCLL
jgi:hypothetical protein